MLIHMIKKLTGRIILMLCILIFVFSQSALPQSNLEKNQATSSILNYLKRISSDITHHSLDDFQTLDDLLGSKESRYNEFAEMMSLMDVPLKSERSPLNIVYVDTLYKDGYRIEKLYYESLPGLHVIANLYVPDSIDVPVPAILYTCGHAGTQKVYYQAHPRKFAQLGFVCLIIETIQHGEITGHHYGPYNNGWFNWYSRGYTPGGVEAWNGIRGLDLLWSRPEVDTTRLGVTGNSGGGAQSWYIPALDERVKASATSCATSTLENQVHTRSVNTQCDCMTPTNTYLIDFHNIGALIAPRPFMIVSNLEDLLYRIDGARQVHEYVREIYQLYGAEDSLYFVEGPGDHGYNEYTTPRIFQFFLKHLMDIEMTVDEIGDVNEADSVQLSEEELRVLVDGLPPGDITADIQDQFIELASIPSINSVSDLEQEKDDVKQGLLKKTFNAFPDDDPPFDSTIVIERSDGILPDTTTIIFYPEPEWPLKMIIHWRNSREDAHPVMMTLRNPLADTTIIEDMMNQLDSHWSIAYFDARGIGNTIWSKTLSWYVRRASAWTGRTVASMRVYDVLRGLQLLKSTDGVDTENIGIAAMGEMCATGLYAALLDDQVAAMVLNTPPATQDAPSRKDGMGESIEMLNCLRITDIAQVAGYLYPAEIVMVDSMPDTYAWTMDLYARLGKADYFTCVENLSQWSPYTPVSTDDFLDKAESFELFDNYPNPFNPHTMISFNLPNRSRVQISIYNALGRRVKTLVNDVLPGGSHSYRWDGMNDMNINVASGLYFYEMIVEDKIVKKKMLLLK